MVGQLKALLGPDLQHLRVEEHPDLHAAVSGAVFSPCDQYRYVLTRAWNPDVAPLVFLMLNPSTADASVDDRTIGRCCDFARREEAGGILVVNAYALRATDPATLKTHPDPVGPDNDTVLATVAAKVTGPLVLAWGANTTLHRGGRNLDVVQLLHAAGREPQCLGLTKDGHPRHPLYLPSNTPLVDYTFPKEV